MTVQKVESNSNRKVTEGFQKYTPQIREKLDQFLPQESFKLYRMVRYHLGFEDRDSNPRDGNFGKLIRPSLCLFSCEATGGDWKQALPAACGIELVHNFSLVHDDIQDGDEERRHSPTVWKIWGTPQGINAGNALNILSNLIFSDLVGKFPYRKVFAVNRVLNKSTLSMIEGQCMDIDFEDRLEITVSQYMEMIEKKTGALIKASFVIGAILGCDDKKIIKKLGQVGKALGLAFQIRDDFLGIWGEGKKTGKPNSSDIRQKKKTLPIIFALQSSNKSRKKILEIYQQDTIGEQELTEIRKLLTDTGSKTFTQKKSRELITQAKTKWEELCLPTWAIRDMESLTNFLLHRER